MPYLIQSRYPQTVKVQSQLNKLINPAMVHNKSKLYNPVGTNLHNHVMSDKLRTWIRGYTGSCVSFYSGFCRSEPTKLTWVYGKLCQFVKHSSVGTDLQD